MGKYGLGELSILKPAWQTVAYKGVPMFRAHAWALLDAELHGIPVVPYSANRQEGVAERFGKSSQAALYRGWLRRLPGFNPANPPGFSSHELKSDGNPFYGPRGGNIPKFKLGLDVVSVPGGDCLRIVKWMNNHGYRTRQVYPGAINERHHMGFERDPAPNAKKRLRRYYLNKAKEAAKAKARRKR